MCLGKKALSLPVLSDNWTLQGALQIIVTFWESWNSSSSCRCIFCHVSFILLVKCVMSVAFYFSRVSFSCICLLDLAGIAPFKWLSSALMCVICEEYIWWFAWLIIIISENITLVSTSPLVLHTLCWNSSLLGFSPGEWGREVRCCTKALWRHLSPHCSFTSRCWHCPGSNL